MGTAYSARHAAVLMLQLPPRCRLRRAYDKSAEWSEEAYLLARLDYDLQCIALRGTKITPRMMRTPADAARVDRMRMRADPDEIADKLGIPKDRR